MVLGCADAITCDPEVTQCADITHTASGLGSRTLNPLSASVKALSSIAFIGDPCPTNNTGIFSAIALFRNEAHRYLLRVFLRVLRGLPLRSPWFSFLGFARRARASQRLDQ